MVKTSRALGAAKFSRARLVLIWLLETGERLLRKFYADRDLIPSKNLSTIKFEELVANPISQLRLMYENLGIDNLIPEKTVEDLIRESADAFGSNGSLDFEQFAEIQSRFEFLSG